MRGCSVLFFVGLPGSRKADLARALEGFEVFEDYLFSPRTAMQSIRRGESVCLIDPKLCVSTIFDKAVDRVRELVPERAIGVVLFDNLPYRCIVNVLARRAECTHDFVVATRESVLEYSRLFDHDNYRHRYRHVILEVEDVLFQCTP